MDLEKITFLQDGLVFEKKIMEKSLYRKLIVFASLGALFLFGFSGCSGSSKWDTVRVAVEGAYPPFSQTEADGTVTGFDIDITYALCDYMDVKCETVSQEWDGMIPGLLAKKYDAIVASMSITEEREEKVNFTTKYYGTKANFVARKGSGLEITDDIAKNKEVLKGLRIGVQNETVSETYVKDNYGDVAEIRLYGKQDEANLDLVNGRLDLIFADTFAIDYGFLRLKQGADFELVGPGYSDEKWFGRGIGIAIRKEDEDLLKLFNEAIKTIRDNGVYEEIQNKYFDYDIYGK